MPINKRQSNTCSPGYSFYTCATGYKGCCSQEACTDPDGCPDDKRDPLDPLDLESASQGDIIQITDNYRSSTAVDTSTYPLEVNTPRRTIASTSTPTVQSSSATQASLPTSETLSASQSSATVAAETAATEEGTSSSKSTSTTPIIIGAVVGLVASAIAIWLVWLGVRRRRRRIRDEATKPEREDWLQGSPESGQGLGISSGQDEHNRTPHSPWSYMYPSKQDGSVPSSESSPNNGGLFPSPTVPSELSAEPPPKPELPPHPETLEINKTRHRSGLSTQGTPTTASHPSPGHPPESSEMRSNLEVSDEEDKRRGSHVMSWMTYSNGAAGPAPGPG
ncbi:MAG: hypothetical protein LQ337_003553 [Flavoplaca oasis]|nr:MAG: hypothetical protein LQ337_003553 [Flavoplaca oasis]